MRSQHYHTDCKSCMDCKKYYELFGPPSYIHIHTYLCRYLPNPSATSWMRQKVYVKTEYSLIEFRIILLINWLPIQALKKLATRQFNHRLVSRTDGVYTFPKGISGKHQEPRPGLEPSSPNSFPTTKTVTLGVPPKAYSYVRPFYVTKRVEYIEYW